jgi:hypothetical protein
MRNVVWFPILLLVLASGCASAPDDQVASAQAALDRARQAEAETYAPEQFDEAVQALDNAKGEIRAQDEEWFFSRDYAQAESLLQRAENGAEQASQQAPAAKQQAKEIAERALAEARDAIETARQELSMAPRGKGATADLEAFERDLAQAESSLDRAQQELQAEAYFDALSKLQSVKADALSVAEEIRAAR